MKGKITGKQILDNDLSLNKLSGTGNVTLNDNSQFQIIGTASNPNDVATLKDIELSKTPLQITDFISGATFSNVTNIIFRGQTVTTPSGTVSGVRTNSDGNNNNSVVVWIPAPIYVDYFNDNSNVIPQISTTDRLVAFPNGSYNVGGWTFSPNTQRKTITDVSINLTCNDFSVFDLTTTMSLTIRGGNNNILESASLVLNSAGGIATSTNTAVFCTAFSPDNDRYKASVSFTILIGNMLPNGGRFSIEIEHDNSPDGVYTYTQNDIFYDSDGLTSNAVIDVIGGGTVSIEENNPTLKWLSGISYYDTNSDFTFSVTNIDNINDRSFPRGTTNNTNPSTGKQMRISSSNFAISNNIWAHSTNFNGWDQNYDTVNLSFSDVSSINVSSQYEPGFSSNNTIANSSSYIEANLYDWNLADSVDSPIFPALIDTYNDTTSYDNNPIIDEDDRHYIDDSGATIIVDIADNFDPQVQLRRIDLQTIFGRVIYPQTNFSNYYPSINITNSRDYSSLPTTMTSFRVNLYINTSTANGSVSVSQFTDYRWAAYSFGKNSSYTSDFSNGIFDLSSNFSESDLHHDQVSSQNQDLIILVGIDSTGNNSVANRFFWVSNDANTFPGRSSAVTYNLNGGTKQIQFSKGSLSVSVRRCWLLVGFRNTTRGRNLYLNDVSFS